MLTIRTLGLGVVISTAWVATGRTQALQTPPRETFEQLDVNGDGVIEKAEVPQKALPAFERLLKLGDSDKDGKLQGNEFRDLVLMLRSGGPGVPGNSLGMFAVDPMGRFKSMDKNGDGKVSREEFTGRPAMFERVDANKDGYLNTDEVKALVASTSRPPAPAPGAARPGSRIMAMDRNGDGKVGRDEYTGAPNLFDRLDSNADGFLVRDEAAEGPRVMLELLRGMDANGDGKLSRDEFRGPAERFDQLDVDKNGFVEFDEIRATPPMASATPAAAVKKAENAKQKE